MIMIAVLLDKNLSSKTTINSIKLSTHQFHGKMREIGLKMRRIERLNGTFARTRSTLFSKYTLNTQSFTRRIKPNECKTNLGSIQLT
jgi:hypothetical protein